MPAGRPRKPTAKKILEGDQPCRINRNEPKPAPGGVGPPPLHLRDKERAAWRYFVAMLEPMGVLSSADAAALAILCVNHALWIKARDEIDREGLSVPTQFSTKPHPMIAVANRCEATMAKILAQFGMTPSARSALDLGKNDDDDEFDGWVKEGHKPPDGPAKAPKPAG